MLNHGRAMDLEDFAGLEKGQEIFLHYYDGNAGCFQWRHDRVDGDRVYGAFKYDDDDWSEVSDYLYEHGGYVCRGSGAEICRYGFSSHERLEMLADLSQPSYWNG